MTKFNHSLLYDNEDFSQNVSALPDQNSLIFHPLFKTNNTPPIIKSHAIRADMTYSKYCICPRFVTPVNTLHLWVSFFRFKPLIFSSNGLDASFFEIDLSKYKTLQDEETRSKLEDESRKQVILQAKTELRERKATSIFKIFAKARCRGEDIIRSGNPIADRKALMDIRMSINKRICQISNSHSQIRQIVNELALLYKGHNHNALILELISKKLVEHAAQLISSHLESCFSLATFIIEFSIAIREFIDVFLLFLSSACPTVAPTLNVPFLTTFRIIKKPVTRWHKKSSIVH